MRPQASFEISSPSFGQGEAIPVRHTCDGEDISPTLHFSGIPDQSRSIALVVEDPDAPKGNWVHWVVWNIPPRETIREGSVPGTEGMNDFRQQHYGGPCPPSGTHRYYFRAYALDDTLDLPPSADRYQLAEHMQGHILAEAEWMGRYSRKS
jgi:hypothetical protein